MHSFTKILYLEIIGQLINIKNLYITYIKYSSIAIATFYGKIQREFTFEHSVASLSIHDLRIKI
jgi:hypothetical protein